MVHARTTRQVHTRPDGRKFPDFHGASHSKTIRRSPADIPWLSREGQGSTPGYSRVVSARVTTSSDSPLASGSQVSAVMIFSIHAKVSSHSHHSCVLDHREQHRRAGTGTIASTDPVCCGARSHDHEKWGRSNHEWPLTDAHVARAAALLNVFRCHLRHLRHHRPRRRRRDCCGARCPSTDRREALAGAGRERETSSVRASVYA